jgi:hypothetical protein
VQRDDPSWRGRVKDKPEKVGLLSKPVLNFDEDFDDESDARRGRNAGSGRIPSKLGEGKHSRMDEYGKVVLDGPCFLKMLMPNHIAGALIGKEGIMIGEIVMRTRCQMQISEVDNFFPGTTDRIVVMGGTMKDLEKCIQLSLRRLKEVSGKSERKDKSQLLTKLAVPSSAVSGLIGHQGDKVKKLSDQMNCRINMSGRVEGMKERLVLICGEFDDLVDAVIAIARDIQGDAHLKDNLHLKYDHVRLPLGAWSAERAQPADPDVPLIPAEHSQYYTKREIIEYLHKAAPREILLKHKLLGNMKNTLKSKGGDLLKEALKDTLDSRMMMASSSALLIRERPREQVVPLEGELCGEAQAAMRGLQMQAPPSALPVGAVQRLPVGQLPVGKVRSDAASSPVAATTDQPTLLESSHTTQPRKKAAWAFRSDPGSESSCQTSQPSQPQRRHRSTSAPRTLSQRTITVASTANPATTRGRSGTQDSLTLPLHALDEGVPADDDSMNLFFSFLEPGHTGPQGHTVLNADQFPFSVSSAQPRTAVRTPSVELRRPKAGANTSRGSSRRQHSANAAIRTADVPHLADQHLAPPPLIERDELQFDLHQDSERVDTCAASSSTKPAETDHHEPVLRALENLDEDSDVDSAIVDELDSANLLGSLRSLERTESVVTETAKPASSSQHSLLDQLSTWSVMGSIDVMAKTLTDPFRTAVDSIGEKVESRLHASTTTAITFKPGRLGMGAHWDTGEVILIAEDGQAHDSGAKVGSYMKLVDGDKYTEHLLQQKIEGEQDYEVTFASSQEPPPAAAEVSGACAAAVASQSSSLQLDMLPSSHSTSQSGLLQQGGSETSSQMRQLQLARLSRWEKHGKSRLSPKPSSGEDKHAPGSFRFCSPDLFMSWFGGGEGRPNACSPALAVERPAIK